MYPLTYYVDRNYDGSKIRTGKESNRYTGDCGIEGCGPWYAHISCNYQGISVDAFEKAANIQGQVTPKGILIHQPVIGDISITSYAYCKNNH